MLEAATLISRDDLNLPNDFRMPSTELERAICAAFSNALRVQPVGLDDEFYDLGGDSLIGENLSMEIERAVGKPFAISQLFEFDTPRKVASLLAENATPQGRRQTAEDILFIVHGRGGYTALLPEFRNAVKSGRRLHTFELPGIRGDGPLVRNLSDLAAVYVSQIEELQPHGPVRLAAFCVGSMIALEMAAILEDRGRAIDRVVLLDPRLPNRVNRRFKAELALKSSGRGVLPSLRYFMATGRLPGSDFLAPLFDALAYRRARSIELRGIEQQRKRGVSFAKRDAGLGLSDKPRAALIASYRFSWPRPFRGTAYILASEDRLRTFNDPQLAWQWFTPDRVVEQVAGRHGEIGNASASTVARRIDEILS